ncbi:hypothetical protein FVR03_11555 [Pontibacter qinzhouensis]|uniref:Uncharacterized protein n=1 Tax=Pontibacter qinzhouensis TaxID=2603253 RepID=A0A5C8K964_9BACT|nr:hypothetical protein [Pontibacter qinzhouensis]TXK45935.1 hypothetical protein FVR03_11555 [Pontibacter qinzhouensis]
MKPIRWIFVLLLFSAFQCSEDEVILPATTPAPVTQFTMPERASLGEPVTIEVFFTVNNGCGRFGEFSESRSGNTFTIAVHPVYVGEACTMDMPTRKANYTFIPTIKGTYTFRFWQAQDQYVTRTITIE